MLKILLSLLSVLCVTTYIGHSFAQANMGADKKQDEHVLVTLDDVPELKANPTPIIADSIINPLTFMGRDGRIYRLSGLDSPALSDPEADPAFIEEAQNALSSLIIGQTLLLYETQDKDVGRQNHFGHYLVHVLRQDDKSWIQGTLLANGLVRVRTTPFNPELASLMYTYEASAREQSHGLWQNDRYGVLNADALPDYVDGFQIIEGKIYSASLVRNTIYLNFGQNWKEDFSIGIEPALRRNLAKDNVSPQQWGGRTIRIRGPVRFYNGPFMDLTHTEQIEFLDSAQN